MTDNLQGAGRAGHSYGYSSTYSQAMTTKRLQLMTLMGYPCVRVQYQRQNTTTNGHSVRTHTVLITRHDNKHACTYSLSCWAVLRISSTPVLRDNLHSGSSRLHSGGPSYRPCCEAPSFEHLVFYIRGSVIRAPRGVAHSLFGAPSFEHPGI